MTFCSLDYTLASGTVLLSQQGYLASGRGKSMVSGHMANGIGMQSLSPDMGLRFSSGQ
ncbi:hypothetical protein [Anaplasma phagocytophilum]|uniref:hypothetical protein n=1 Tax=Anaplasma phagocytophilum TaxID=948 RepID=UPI000A689493|nr:hypothetical protein [Anaplasma phagocytophilum]